MSNKKKISAVGSGVPATEQKGNNYKTSITDNPENIKR